MLPAVARDLQLRNNLNEFNPTWVLSIQILYKCFDLDWFETLQKRNTSSPRVNP